MARSIQTIYNQIVASVQADKNLYDPTNTDPSKRGLTSTSRVALWSLWAWIIATSQALLEQLIDVYQSQIEAKVSQSPAGTTTWVQNQVYRFQYSPTDAQVIQLDMTTFAPYYAVVNTDLRIVTQCSVTTLPNKIVSIKVAKGGSTPAPLDSTELLSLNGYLDYINFAGVYFQLISQNADLIYLGVDVYYNGQYSAVIQSSVEDAINNYLSNVNSQFFNSVVYLTKLQDVIQSVAGVRDVVFKQVEVRPDTVLPINAYKMVNNYTTLLRQYQPYAGYMIADTASGRTLADSINYIVSNI